MAYRSVVARIGALVAGSGAQMAANAVAALAATLWLPVEQRGLMVLILTIASVASLIGGLGIGNIYRSRVPTVAGSELLALRVSYTWSSLLSVIVASLLGVLACWIFGRFETGLADVGLLYACGIATAVQTVHPLITEARFAHNDYVKGAVWAALASFGGLIGLGAGNLLQPSATSLTIGQSLGTTVVLLVAGVCAFRVSALRIGRLRLASVWNFIGRGCASMGLPFGIAILSRADRLILGAIISPQVLAVYALAATVAELLRLVPTAVGQLTTQGVAEGRGWREVVRTTRITAVTTLLSSIIMYFLAASLIPVVFGDDYSAVPSYLPLLCLSELFFAVLIILSRALIGGEWSKDGSIVGAASLVVGIPVYLVCTLIWGVFGCLFARVLVMSVVAFLAYVRLRRNMLNV